MTKVPASAPLVIPAQLEFRPASVPELKELARSAAPRSAVLAYGPFLFAQWGMTLGLVVAIFGMTYRQSLPFAKSVTDFIYGICFLVVLILPQHLIMYVPARRGARTWIMDGPPRDGDVLRLAVFAYLRALVAEAKAGKVSRDSFVPIRRYARLPMLMGWTGSAHAGRNEKLRPTAASTAQHLSRASKFTYHLAYLGVVPSNNRFASAWRQVTDLVGNCHECRENLVIVVRLTRAWSQTVAALLSIESVFKPEARAFVDAAMRHTEAEIEGAYSRLAPPPPARPTQWSVYREYWVAGIGTAAIAILCAVAYWLQWATGPSTAVTLVAPCGSAWLVAWQLNTTRRRQVRSEDDKA